MTPSLEQTKPLDCKLTPEEVERIAAKLSTEIPDLVELKEEAKDTAKEYREQIKEREQRISILARKVRYRSEIRSVLCRLIPRQDAEIVDIVRTDTGEVIETRQMTPHELQVFRQGTLDLEGLREEAKDFLAPRKAADGSTLSVSILPAEDEALAMGEALVRDFPSEDDSDEELGVS